MFKSKRKKLGIFFTSYGKKFFFLFFQLKETASHENDDNMINRFRANLIVNGGKPFMEDEWKNIEIGNFTFKASFTVHFIFVSSDIIIV